MSESDSSAEVRYKDRVIESISVNCVSRDYAEFGGYKVERGRLVTPAEIDRKRPVAVIGWDVADKLFPDEDPLDKVITVAGSHVRVVGVNEKKGSIFGSSQDQFAVIPIGLGAKLFGARQRISLTAKPADPRDTIKAMDEATVALRIERRLKPSRPNNFGIVTSDTFLDMFRQITAGIFGVLIGVVALSLVVGGIVIMNIMLMVVSERTAEIGLRKALGAKRTRHHLAVPGRVDRAVHARRRRRAPRSGSSAAWVVTKFTPDARVGARLLGRHGHRDDGGGRAVLRAVPVDQGGQARSDRSVEAGIARWSKSLSSPTRSGWPSGRSGRTRCARRSPSSVSSSASPPSSG